MGWSWLHILEELHFLAWVFSGASEVRVFEHESQGGLSEKLDHAVLFIQSRSDIYSQVGADCSAVTTLFAIVVDTNSTDCEFVDGCKEASVRASIRAVAFHSEKVDRE